MSFAIKGLDPQVLETAPRRQTLGALSSLKFLDLQPDVVQAWYARAKSVPEKGLSLYLGELQEIMGDLLKSSSLPQDTAIVLQEWVQKMGGSSFSPLAETLLHELPGDTQAVLATASKRKVLGGLSSLHLVFEKLSGLESIKALQRKIFLEVRSQKVEEALLNRYYEEAQELLAHEIRFGEGRVSYEAAKEVFQEISCHIKAPQIQAEIQKIPHPISMQERVARFRSKERDLDQRINRQTQQCQEELKQARTFLTKAHAAFDAMDDLFEQDIQREMHSHEERERILLSVAEEATRRVEVLNRTILNYDQEIADLALRIRKTEETTQERASQLRQLQSDLIAKQKELSKQRQSFSSFFTVLGSIILCACVTALIVEAGASGFSVFAGEAGGESTLNIAAPPWAF